ncbi:MAG: hypothetical protein ACTSPV_07105 [Candidatus Hodarchaeales archaeon]
MSSSIIKEIKRYWMVQLFVVLVLAGYFLFMGVGFYNVLLGSQNNLNVNYEVKINLWIISERPEYNLNFSSRNTVVSNLTLIEYLNNTLGRDNWAGIYYGSYGWFITRIFNVSEGEGWFWLYYYRLSAEDSWTLGQVGVSHFKLDQNYDIKFVFSHN